MEIRTIRKGFEAFKYKFEPFERDLKHSISNSNHSKGIRKIRIQIRTIRKGFEGFETKFKPFERVEAFESKFEAIEKDSKHSNQYTNHSKEIRSIRLQIQTLPTSFK